MLPFCALDCFLAPLWPSNTPSGASPSLAGSGFLCGPVAVHRLSGVGGVFFCLVSRLLHFAQFRPLHTLRVVVLCRPPLRKGGRPISRESQVDPDEPLSGYTRFSTTTRTSRRFDLSVPKSQWNVDHFVSSHWEPYCSRGGFWGAKRVLADGDPRLGNLPKTLAV